MADLATHLLSHFRLISISIFLIFLSTITVNLISLNSQHEFLPGTEIPNLIPPNTNPIPHQGLFPSQKQIQNQISQIPLDSISSPQLDSSSSEIPKGIRILISYIYTESASSYLNLIFFLKYGVYSNADFIFILNGKLDREKYDYVDIWNSKGDRNGSREGNGNGNLRVLEREKGDCGELGALWEVLRREEGKGRKEGRGRIMDAYNRFILLSSKVKGPFIKEGKEGCWSEGYLRRLSKDVKLVGATVLCHSPNKTKPYIPFLIYASGTIGLTALFEPAAIGSCFSSPQAQEEAEIRTTAFLMEEKKYSVDVLDSSKRKEGGGVKCGVYGNGTAGGNGDGEVWEMMFVVSPGKSEEEDKKVKKLSEEMGKRNVSSFYACGKHPWK